MKRMKSIVFVLAFMLCITNVIWPANCKVTGKTTSAQKAKIKLNKKKATIRVGQTLQLKLKNAKIKKVKWISKNKKVATVSKKGLVKGIQKGTAKIVAKYKGKKYSAKIKVKKALTITIKDIDGSTLSQGIYLLDQLDRNNNIIVSPVSLNMVLGMAANGASDDVKKDCEKYLGSPISEYNQSVQKLMKRAKNDSMLSLANAVWYLDSLKAKDAFSNQVQEYYNATVEKADMKENTVNRINQWADENTDGMIKRILDEIPKDTVAILANALLFDGKWTTPFESTNTYKEKFADKNGTKKEVDMMHSTEGTYYENDYATGFEKYYGDNHEYSLIAILPKKEGAFKMENLDIANFLKSKTTKYDVRVSMPKFTYDWNDSLDEPLNKTSLKSIYNPAINPLGNMLETQDPVYASTIKQSCKIIVDEKGTKAAAVTHMVVATASVSTPETYKTVKLDRPFGYLIKDNQTGEVLFIGKVLEIK